MNNKIKITLWIIGLILTILLFFAAAFYFWPTTDRKFQIGISESASYEQSIEHIASLHKQESKNGVLPECASTLMSHGHKTAKTVVMLHGITACPKQFSELGKMFFDQGYNVYIPRAPHHGFADTKQHKNVVTKELVDYANDSVTVATGLGDELGVIGLSGGGAIASWAAEYRTEVSRLLVLSPFYEPDASQAPKWQLPLLKKLYGYHLLANAYSGPDETGFSLWALANYLILTDNLKEDPTGLNLKSIGVVTSAADGVIDHNLAVSIPQTIAAKNDLTLLQRELPKEWNVGHAIVSPDETGVPEHKQELYKLYQAFYEGRRP